MTVRETIAPCGYSHGHEMSAQNEFLLVGSNPVGIHPASHSFARSDSSTELATPSLILMFSLWVSTVLTLIPREAAISRFALAPPIR